jgi:hypothetical protein
VKKLVFTLFALSLVCGAQLHLPALQVVAWTGMVVKYAQDVPLGEALEMTFDGDHPCPLCKVIRKAQTTGQQELTAPAASERIQLYIDATRSWRPTFMAWQQWVAPNYPACSTFPRPPVPPPRSVA